MGGAAVYLWHCDIDGNYSLYSQAVTKENYLRGVQETDANGTVSFTTIFPACYAGRWPHIHFEVYPSLAKATASTSKIATSQLALPEATCKTVYATSGYSKSVSNLSQVSLKTDNVFSDGADRETPTVTGSVADGYAFSLTVPVKARRPAGATRWALARRIWASFVSFFDTIYAQNGRRDRSGARAWPEREATLTPASLTAAMNSTPATPL